MVAWATPAGSRVTQPRNRPVHARRQPLADVEVAAAERALGVALPASYRVFLLHFAPGWIGTREFYGISRVSLRGDVVLLNHLAGPSRPAHFVQFAADTAGRAFFLDTSRPDDAGECPVVAWGPGPVECTVATSFLDFLGDEPGTCRTPAGA
jgi:hypothetical protein